jgi:hypothetical protein
MADADHSALGIIRGLRTAVGALLVLVALLATAPSAHAVDRQAAAKKALAALDVQKGDEPVIVFGLRGTLPPGTLVSQAGPSGAAAAPAARSRFELARQRRIRSAGVEMRRTSSVIRAGSEPVWLFHEDAGPSQAFEHPGRIVLVGARTGAVRVSREIRWVPLVAGRVLPFFRTARAYESERYRVFSRAWPTSTTRRRARTRQAGDGSRQEIADALAAEKSCALRVSDTVGDFFDFGRVDVTRARLGNLLEGLEDLNAGFVSRRYTTKAGLTPIQAAQALIDDAGCRDLLMYVAGAGPRSGEAGIVIGMRPVRGGAIEWHLLTGDQLEALVKRNRDVTFKFVFDTPYARMNAQLIDEPNTLVLLSSGGPATPSFTFLSELLGANGLEANADNPQQLLEFTNALLGGLWAFTRNPGEYADWQANGRGTSLMAWMLARALGLSPAGTFVAPIELIKLPDLTPPSLGGSSPINHPPVPNTPTQTTREDTAKSITLSASDPDGDPVTFTITGQPDDGTLSGTPPNVVYTPKKDFAGSDGFVYEVADDRGASASEEVAVKVTPSNDAAAVTTTSGGTLPTFVEDGSPVVVDGALTVTDTDSTQLKSATVEIVDGEHSGDQLLFTDQSGITGTYANGLLSLTGIATLTQYRNALRSVEFDTTSQAPGLSRTIEFRAEDGDDLGVAGSRDIDVEPVNDAPELSVPGAQSTDEDTARTFATSSGNAISVSDPDAGGGAIDVDLDVDHGTLTLGSTSGLASTSGNGTGTVALSGTVSAVNTALSGLDYDPDANYHGADTLDAGVDDAGHDGTGGAKTDSATVALTVDSVNDVPVNTVPAAQTFDEDTSRSMDLGVADADGGDLGITISVLHGTITLGGTSGLANLSGNGTDTVTFDGTPAEATAAMDDLVYAPATNYNGSDTLTLESDDGAATDTDTVDLDVSSVNDAPVNALPATLGIDEDEPHTFTTAGVSDADAGGDDIEVHLDVEHGRIALDGTSGLTFTAGTNNSAAMTFTGSQSDADAALSGMVYTPTAHYFGSDTLDMVTSDLGNNGPGTQTDSDSTAITIESVADAPVNTVPGAQDAVENTELTLDTISVQDADTANLEVTLDVDHGTLTLATTDGLTFAAGGGDGTDDGTMVFSGSQPALNAALDGVEYTPTTGYVGSDTLTVTSDDGALSDTDTVAISVAALNKAPVNTVPGAQTVDEDTNLVFSSGNGNAISVADSDAAGDDLRVSVSVGMGGLTLGTTAGLVFSAGDGTGDSSMVFEGTLSELNAALAGLTYRGAGNYNGGDALSITTNDLGNNGAGGAQSDTDTVNITVSAVNDAPEHIVPGAQTAAEGGTLTLSTANMNRLAVGDADAGSNPLETTLTVDHGALTLASTDGLTFTTGDGAGDATMTFSGTRTAINTALDGLQYTPATDYAGAEELSIVTSDQGNSGSGGAKTDSDDLAVTVSAVNDAPTIGVPAGPLTLAENSSTQVTVSVADVDADSGDLAVTLSVDHGTITLATTSGLVFTDGADNSGAMTFEGTLAELNAAMNDLTYAPIANYFGADALSASVDDKGNTGSGGAKSDSDSVAFDVEEANSPPVNSVPGTQTFDEDTNRTFSSANGNAITISDPDALADDDLEMRLQSTHGVLDVTASTGDLTSISGDGTNDLTVRGTASELNAALDGLVYDSDQHYAGAANINVIAADLGNRGAGGQKMDNDDVALSISAVNDGPSLSEPADFDVDEGATKTLSGAAAHQVSDVDASSVEVALGVAHGTLTLDGTSGLTFTAGDGTGDAAMTFSGTVTNVNAALDGMQYAANSNDGSSDTLSVSVDDKGSTGGGSLTDSDAVAITINALNEAPVVSVPGTQTFDEDTTRSFSTGNGNAISVSDGDAGGADVRTTLTATNGLLSIDTTGLDFTCGSCAGDGTNDGTMTFEGTLAETNAALQTLTYAPTANFNGPATITVTTNDLGNSGAGGAQSDSENVALSVSAVNDGPQNTVPGAQSVDEDTNLVLSAGNGNGLSIADVDAGSNDVRVTLAATNGVVSLGGSTSGLTFTAGDGTSDPTMTFDGTVAEVNTAMSSVTFRGTLNYFGSAQVSLTTNDQGNTGSGGSLSDSDAVAITVNPVNDAPVADDETFNSNDGAIGNTSLVVNDPDDGAQSLATPKKSISGDILAGDTDVDEPASQLTVTPGTFATNDGGSVTLQADGDFVFQPATATSCTDTSDFFDYTVEDNSSTTPGELTDTGRVTIAIAGCVWYVHNNASGNSGSSDLPFDTLQQAETASGSGHTVFVYEGDPVNVGVGYGGDGYQMNAGERLIGEHEGLTVGGDALHPANANERPTITATNADAVSLDDGNEIRGFIIDPDGTGGGIAGGSGDTGGGTIDDVSVIDTDATVGAQPGLELDSTTGTFNVSNLVVDNRSTGVRLHNTTVGTNAVNAVFAPAGQISITSTGGPGLDVDGTSGAPVAMGTSEFDDITVPSSATGGIDITNATGPVNLGDGIGNEISLTTSGAAAALSLSNPGTVTLDAAGTDSATNSSGGPALNISNVAGTTLAFDTLSSSNSATNGVRIDNTSGTISAGAGTIQNATGSTADISGNNAGDTVDFTYDGSVSDTTGTLVSIANQSGGVKDFNGSVNGGAISLSSNSGATMRFDGGTTLSTGTAGALSATGGGTLAVTTQNGGVNTLATTTGTALNVANTTIHDDDLTFRSIASTGAANGIVLNNTTNQNGRLVVTGNSGTCTSAASCTGGAIQTSSGTGVALTSVPGGASLSNMAITGGGDDGVRVNDVGTSLTAAGLTIDTSVLSGNGNVAGERGLDASNLRGQSSVSASTITGSAEDNARVANTAGTLDLRVLGSTFSSNSTTLGNDGIQLYGDGNALMRSSINNNTFTANRDDALQVTTGGASDATMHTTFNNNTVNAGGNTGSSNNAAVVVSPAGTSDTFFHMNGGTIKGSQSSALILNPLGTAQFDATIENITIGNAAEPKSGSRDGIGLWAKPVQNSDAEIVIRNSTIQQYAQNGMYLRHNDGTSGDADYTVTGNTIVSPNPGLRGIYMESGATATDTQDVCADIGGAGGLANSLSTAGGQGLEDIYVTKYQNSTFRFPGLTNNTDAGIASYLANRNGGNGLPTAFYETAGGAAPVTGNNAPCQQPGLPSAPLS